MSAQEGTMEHKFIKAEKSEINENEKSIVGWASKPTMDRDKELILSSAWQLDNYRKNPVVMLCHNYQSLPIGKCLWIKSTDNGLKFKAKFANTERGKEVYDLFQDGILSAFSVGFKPRPGGVTDNPSDVKYKGVKRLFTDVELMEISCVPIPANQDALVDQSSFIKYVKEGHIVTKGLKDELEAIIEIIEKSDDTLEIVAKSTDPNTNTEIKVEVTEDFVHVPSPGEEGKHKECKIRTIPISKKDGIQAHYCIDEKIITGYIFDKEKWDKKTAMKWVEDHKKELVFDVPESEEEPIIIKSEDASWDTDGDIAFIDTKAVTPNADEAEKDFMERCMGDKSMAKLNEGFRANMCKLAWKKKTPAAKDAVVEEQKKNKPSFTPLPDETEEEYKRRFMIDEGMMSEYPKEEDRASAAKETYKACGKKKEPEQDSVINKQESVQDFIKRILPDKSIEIKTAEELAQALEKSSGYDDMKETVGAMESQISAMEPVSDGPIATCKSADAEGNPSLYDLTGAVDRALNADRINPPGSLNSVPSYKSVVDIFTVNYPSGHVVYSAYDKESQTSKYFKIDYEYDMVSRTVSFVGDPEEVLQSWIAERYMTTQVKEEDEIETKAGKVLSAKNKKILSDCMSQMMVAHSAMEEMMKMAEGDMAEEKEEFEIIEKEPEMIELDIKAKDEPGDNLIEVDDVMIKNAIASALSKEMKVDIKGIAAETFAKLTGRATMK
jgi:HK97 family phage prohead protease